jgi:hypothetical protein
VVERITKKDPDAYLDDGRQSRRRTYPTRTVEKPGVSPAVLMHLIGNTVFLRLADVARDLPPYTERVVLLPLDQQPRVDGNSQATAYQRLASELRQAVQSALRQGSKRLLGAYLQSLLGYPDGCTRGEVVVDTANGRVISEAPALPEEDVVYPKERALIELVNRERSRHRRVLVYITHTERRDLSPRLRMILEREGLRVAVLKANTVAADRREEWVAARVQEGVDVLICHPRLVQTGLDLVDWPSIVWFQPEYSVYVLRQASRRSWRIGQRQPVEVTYLVYEGTLQAEALALIAAKMRSALMIEGELPEDGLAALEGDGADLMLALARRLTQEAPGEGQSLEALFAQTHEHELEAEDYLIDGEWVEAVTTEPTAVGPALPDGEAAVLWQHVFAGDEMEIERPKEVGSLASARGRILSLEELACLVRRPKPRRRPPVPEAQLTLFAA